jgi:hypothetical protein
MVWKCYVPFSPYQYLLPISISWICAIPVLLGSDDGVPHLGIFVHHLVLRNLNSVFHKLYLSMSPVKKGEAPTHIGP